MSVLHKPLAFLLCAFLPLVFSSSALAGDPPGGVTPADPAPLTLPRPGASTGDTYVVLADNEDNAGTGVADGDMGGTNPTCIFNYDAIHPIEFNINVTGPLPTTDVQLLLRANDIDETAGEVDEVFFNGTSVGFLTGADDEWSTTVLTVPVGLVVAGNNLVRIQVDINGNGEWCTSLGSAQLVVDGGAATTATCRSLTLGQGGYAPGATVNAAVEADTTLTTQNVQIELNLLDPTATNVTGATQNVTLAGASDDAANFALALPGTAVNGTYTAQALIYDAGTTILQGTCAARFTVNAGVLPPSIPVPGLGKTGLALLFLLLGVIGAFVVRRRATTVRRH